MSNTDVSLEEIIDNVIVRCDGEDTSMLAKAILDVIAPRLKAEGLREALGIARSMLSDYCVDAFEAIEARADALDPPKETK